MLPKVGQKVRWNFAGKNGDTGVVLRVIPRPKHTIQLGGVRAMVEVRWDSTGWTGTVEDRKLVVL